METRLADGCVTSPTRGCAGSAIIAAVKRVIVGILLGVAFIGAMVYAMRRETGVECEVCLDFGGRSACRTTSAVDRQHAVEGAISTACAILSGGVTDGLACMRTRPRSVRCSE
jgi:hypothetical protein